MRTGYVLKTRLSEYGALWLASFVLVLAGAAILEAIQRAWPSERVRVADRGLREGLLLQQMREDKKPPKRRRRRRGRGRGPVAT